MLTQAFATLPPSSKAVHFASQLAVAAAIKITELPVLAVGIAIAVLLAFAIMLYAVPLHLRAQRDRFDKYPLAKGTSHG